MTVGASYSVFACSHYIKTYSNFIRCSDHLTISCLLFLFVQCTTLI